MLRVGRTVHMQKIINLFSDSKKKERKKADKFDLKMREITQRVPPSFTAYFTVSPVTLLIPQASHDPWGRRTHVHLNPSAAEWEPINSLLCVPATNAILPLSSS